ncbi:glycoside hydrolase family protein [Lutibacter citreus]|uniref:glycoside hydrolase family protein n=1 Tax=Lutibacter citreus TaxID=2138210 RepID=UPI000DBE0C5F|nr:glycoside hydrolase family protein [Lutibacter citreus]
MNYLKNITFTICLIFGLNPSINCISQVPYVPNQKIVTGGQFKDFILPMPIHIKLTDKKIWGAKNVLPRDVKNGLEDNKWCYWGGNPMLGKDRKYHISIARWKEETGHWGWPKSEVAHAIANNPFGPFKVTGTVLPKAHNPEVVKLNDGGYMLHISGGEIFTSKQLQGPWEKLGKIKIDIRGYKGLSHLFTNLTGLQRKDESFLFFTKRGDVMISNTSLLGPYKIVSVRNYDRYSGYPEDPVIWKSRHQYHVIFNHAVDKKSVYMRSLDGINWKIESGKPYDVTVFRYTDGTKNKWAKFERPKVQQDSYGRATHLSLAVIDVEKHLDLGNDNHSSKHVIMPLAVERLIEIVNTKPIDNKTTEVKVSIKAEKNFNPQSDINMESLRLGSSDEVNFGKGAKVKSFTATKDGLILTFNWNKTKITSADYDLKLLGKSKTNAIVFGYALLPQKTEDPASLVTVPFKIETKNNKQYLTTVVENFGLKNSTPSKLNIYQYLNQKRNKIKEFEIPNLKPYESFAIEYPINTKDEAEYEIVILEDNYTNKLLNKVDDSHYSIIYNGNWTKNLNGKNIYKGSEQVSEQEGASAVYFFHGTQAKCYGNINKKMGSAEVYIDDNFIEKIDCYFGTNLHNVVIYETCTLPKGLHKLEIRVTGKHYKGNLTGPIAIDAFSYKE